MEDIRVVPIIFVQPRAWDMRPWETELAKARPHRGQWGGVHCDVRRVENTCRRKRSCAEAEPQLEGWSIWSS